MEEKIIKILELVQMKDDGTVEFSEESKKLIHEIAEKCRILPIYQQNKEKVNTYKDGMTAKQVYIDMCSFRKEQQSVQIRLSDRSLHRLNIWLEMVLMERLHLLAE